MAVNALHVPTNRRGLVLAAFPITNQVLFDDGCNSKEFVEQRFRSFVMGEDGLTNMCYFRHMLLLPGADLPDETYDVIQLECMMHTYFPGHFLINRGLIADMGEVLSLSLFTRYSDLDDSNLIDMKTPSWYVPSSIIKEEHVYRNKNKERA